jgi:hypothetical protein
MITPAEITRAIIRDVAERHGTTPEEILSKRGPRRLLAPRIELAKLLTARGHSLPKVGRLMNRDHSTVAFYLIRLANKQPSPRSLAPRPEPAPTPAPEPPQPRYPVRYAGYDPSSAVWRNGNKTTTT